MIPQNIEAEQNVLCAMLIDKKAANLVAAKLKPEDFYRISHQLIYRAMLNLLAKNKPVDLVTVPEELSNMGKTALALNIAQNVALRGAKEGEQHKRVAFFSLEMSRDQLVQRIICSEADIDKQDLGRRGKSETTQDEKMQLLNRVWAVSDKIATSAMYIDDTPFLFMQEMRSKARRLKAEGGLSLIVIDYLQLMNGATAGGFTENRQHQVSEISRGLKALARELDVPVLALSQLSRNVESRQVKRPMLSDLRESGSLEQDADIVMFLYREDYYKSAAEAPDHLTELIVAKHRNGPVGKINLFFKDDCTKFISMNEKDAC